MATRGQARNGSCSTRSCLTAYSIGITISAWQTTNAYRSLTIAIVRGNSICRACRWVYTFRYCYCYIVFAACFISYSNRMGTHWQPTVWIYIKVASKLIAIVTITTCYVYKTYLSLILMSRISISITTAY